MPDVFKNDLYLSRKTASDGELVTILDEGKWIPNKFKEGEELFQLRVEHNGAEKLWTLNNRSRKNIGQAFGGDSVAWIGKSVRLSLEQGQSGSMLVGYPSDTVRAEDTAWDEKHTQGITG